MHKEFQALTAEERRTLTLLIPILRLADNLERSQQQRIQSVEMRMHDGEVSLLVHSAGDLNLEEWRAERAGEVAAVVTFLASPLSVGITGDAIAAGGGARGPIYY